MHLVHTAHLQQLLLEPELCHLTSNYNASNIKRLTRLQQLTLSTWRLAGAKVARTLDPFAVVDQVALHAVIGALREVDQPLALFAHHATADPELALIVSLIGHSRRADLAYDILDTAYLTRWNELVARGGGPEELPPLEPHPMADGRHPANGC